MRPHARISAVQPPSPLSARGPLKSPPRFGSWKFLGRSLPALESAESLGPPPDSRARRLLSSSDLKVQEAVLTGDYNIHWLEHWLETKLADG